MKKNKIDKEKVKAVLKKCLDVFCYITTALAVVLGIAMGINSCSGSDETKRIDQQHEAIHSLRNIDVPQAIEYNVYAPNYSVGQISTDFDYLRSAMNIPTSFYAVEQELRYANYFFDSESYWIAENGDLHRIVRIGFIWNTYRVQSGTPQFEYKLMRVFIHDADDANLFYIYDRTSEYSTEDLGTINRARLVLSEQEIEYEGFLAFWHLSEDKIPFTFNASFNYNAPFGLPYNAVYGSSISWTGGGDQMKYMTYNIGWFASNGRLFDQIKWWAIKGDGVAVVIDNQIATLPVAGNWVYTFMYYVNSVSGEEVLVNSRDSLPYRGGEARYYANSSTWQVPAYRNITLLTTPSDTIVDLLGSFNNNNAYDTGLSVGGDLGDVFTLIGGAFTGLLPILTLQILPSVTIGTLLFVPLVAMLVFAIIRIIKK